MKILSRLKSLFTGKKESPTLGELARAAAGKGESAGGKGRGQDRSRRRGKRRSGGRGAQEAGGAQGRSQDRKAGPGGQPAGKQPHTKAPGRAKPESASAAVEASTAEKSEAQREGSRRHSKGRRPQNASAASAQPAAETAEKSGRRGRDRHRGHGKKKKGELGGSAQRIAFPELLPIDQSSEEFRDNEFRPLGLSDKIVLTLAANRFRTPTDIQQAMIPVALRGADLLGQAKTGTGKTVAFLMPIFDRLTPGSGGVGALIVVPTRELCRQVTWEARRFGRSLGFTVLSLYGGTSVLNEIEHLKGNAAQIVVGTPGRLLDHIFNNNLDLSGLKILVLDEADRMFDIGFRQDIIKIIKACPAERQIMLLSATLDKEVEDLSRHYMKDPVPLYLSRDEITVESIWQRYITLHSRQKIDVLARLLATQKPTQSLIFTNTKRMSDSVALKLAKLGFKAHCIHSDLSQNKRERIIDAFRMGQIEHLVATDVAARGLDITGISHVINYDISENPEDYVHRVGRTGRMGAAGKAFTFVRPEEGERLTAVEKFINKMIEEWRED